MLKIRLRSGARAASAALVFMVGVGSACSGGGTEPGGGGGVEAVNVAPATASVPLGSTLQLTAEALGADRSQITGRGIVWASADSSVASVTTEGVLTARKLGSVQIQAAVGGRSAYAFVSVVPRPVGAVAVSPAAASVAAGATTQLQAAVSDDRGAAVAGQAVIWRSSNDAVARVTSSGLVSGVAPGSATITATAGEGKSGSATVTVTGDVSGGNGGGTTPGAVVVARVTVQPSPNAPPIPVDDTMQITATAFDEAGALVTGRATAWATSNAAVATVGAATGLVRGVGLGEAVVTATIDGRSASTIVTVVRRAARTVDITAPPEITVGQAPVQLTATPRDAGGQPLTGRTVVWSSSNEGTVVVGRTTGIAEARAAGTAVITASVEGEGVTNTTTIIVRPPGGPTADFVFGCTNLICAFTDRSTGTNGAQPTTWRWEFGDGTTSPFRNSDVVYSGAGTFTVKLTITDDRGASASASRTVTVANNAPVVQLVNRATGQCLSVDLNGASDPRGSPLAARACDGRNDQRYSLPTGAGVGPLQLTRYTNRYVELQTGDGDPLRIWQWHGAQFQRWTYARTGELRHHVTDRCITATGGPSVRAESCTAQDNQRWDVRQ